jgi:hypothetical protein
MLLVAFALFLAGCSGVEPTPTPTVIPTDTPVPTKTPAPTATSLPPVGVLLVPDGADPALAARLQTFLSEQIPPQGMRFQVRPSLSRDDFKKDDFQWIIALPPYADLGPLAASIPQSRFLAVGFADLMPAQNLSVISQPEDWAAQQAFMAGYISMVITPDWRAGMLRVNTPEGDLAAQAFRNGALFFCSSPSAPGQELFCRPKYAPVYQYPIIAFGELETAPDEWVKPGRFIVGQYVETVFVSPEINSDALPRYLAEEGIAIIGGSQPPDELREQWAASLEFDLFQVFQEFWPQFVAGVDGQQITVPLVVTYANPDLFSVGRQQFVEIMLADLIAGYVDYVPDTSVNFSFR